MKNILTIVQVVTGILMVVFILMQQRGATLGNAFGGGSSVYRSRRGVEKWLFYASILAAIIFLGTTFATLLI
jgi:preprotein translocase subunit SecG